jgi:hypothetical protein
MSQQEMQFENSRQNYESGYEAFPHDSNDFEAGTFNQKIGAPDEDSDKDGMNAHLREHMLNLRIGMAITSLALWLISFFLALAIILNNPVSIMVQSFIFMGLGVFTVLVILANVLVNRKRV